MKYVSYKLFIKIGFILLFLVSCAKQSSDDIDAEEIKSSGLSAGVNLTIDNSEVGQNRNVINLAPNGEIVRPLLDITITKGKSFTFKGKASDPDSDAALSLLWDFGGYVLNSFGESKTVKFDRLGQVVVTLKVKDSLGEWDPTPAKIKVLIVDVVPVILPAPVPVPSPSPVTPEVPVIVPTIVVEKNVAPEGRIVAPSVSEVKIITKGGSVIFLGNGSDPEAGAVSYAWSFGKSGIAASTLKSPGKKTFTKQGVFKVSLVVTDNKGLSDPTPSVVTINVTNKVSVVDNPPNGIIVSPFADIVLTEGDSYTFKASATDKDGVSGMTYYWNFDGYVLNAIGQSRTVLFDTSSTVNVSLKVKDSSGLWDLTPATIKVVVRPAEPITVDPIRPQNNVAPESYITAPAYNYTIPAGDSIFFSGNGTDPDGDLNLGFYWSFDGAAPDSIKQIPGSIVFDQAGFYAVKLTVTDSFGLADRSAAVKYVFVSDVSATNISPNAIIKSPPADVTIDVGESLRFVGGGVDSDNNFPLKFLWSFDGAMPNTSAQNPGNITFNQAGVYFVTLNVADSQGNADVTPDVRVVTVNDNTVQSTPEGEITSPASNQIIEMGDELLFEGNVISSSTGQGASVSYLWDFDGVSPNSIKQDPGLVTFNNTGIYNIRLRVADSAGVKDPTPAAVQVIVRNTQAVNEAPNGLIASPNADVVINVGDSVMFVGLGMDPDNDVVDYFWDFDGAAPNKQVQSPGLVLFDTAGVYRIVFTVADVMGAVDPSPVIRKITVKSAIVSLVAPDVKISIPVANTEIFVGESLVFSGAVIDTDNAGPFNYYWNFDGAIPNVTQLNPGNIVFTNAGTYRISFNATDADGLSDLTPDERVIVVKPASGALGDNMAPNGVITSPSSNLTVTIGDSLEFTSVATDVDGDFPVNFRWNMDGVMPNPLTQNPGFVTFNQVGTYRIVLTVTDSLGLSDAIPAERIISVVAAQTTNEPPDTMIISPAATETITVGDSLYFSGSGSDVDGNIPLRFYWDFDGQHQNSVGANAGDITFSKAGIFKISLIAVDRLGAIDVTPAEVDVTVNPAEVSPPAEAPPPADQIPANSVEPNGKIVSPLGAVVQLSVGDSYTFIGEATDPNGDADLLMRWDFNGYVPNKVGQSAAVRFSQAGQVKVTLDVMNSLKRWDSTPAEVIVVVQ